MLHPGRGDLEAGVLQQVPRCIEDELTGERIDGELHLVVDRVVILKGVISDDDRCTVLRRIRNPTCWNRQRIVVTNTRGHTQCVGPREPVIDPVSVLDLEDFSNGIALVAVSGGLWSCCDVHPFQGFVDDLNLVAGTKAKAVFDEAPLREVEFELAPQCKEALLVIELQRELSALEDPVVVGHTLDLDLD